MLNTVSEKQWYAVCNRRLAGWISTKSIFGLLLLEHSLVLVIQSLVVLSRIYGIFQKKLHQASGIDLGYFISHIVLSSYL